MKITFEYRHVIHAAQSAIAAYQQKLEESKEKLSTAYSKPYKKGFPGFRRLYTPTREEAWKRAVAKRSIYDSALFERSWWKGSMNDCKNILKKAESAQNSVDGNVTLCDNELQLLKGYL